MSNNEKNGALAPKQISEIATVVSAVVEKISKDKRNGGQKKSGSSSNRGKSSESSTGTLITISQWIQQTMPDTFYYNSMTGEIVINRDLPPALKENWPKLNGYRKYPAPLQDEHVNFLTGIIQNGPFEKARLETVGAAISNAALRHTFHPILEYFNGLKWDGVDRLERVFIEFLGAENNEYNKKTSKMMFMQIAARALEPGCQMDYITIFEGGQGLRKSTFVAALAPVRGWAVANPPPPSRFGSRETTLAVAGKLVVEIADLAGIHDGNIDAWKAFLTAQFDEVRRPYAKNAVTMPRTAVFIGTFNPDASGEYLKDLTGNRRYWPIEVRKTIDVDRFARSRDQIFAEAVHRLRAGESCWPTPEFERKYIVPEQDKRTSTDPWLGVIDNYVKASKTASVDDIKQNALLLAVKDWNQNNTTRVISCLKQLGFKLKRTKTRNIWIRS